MINTKTLFNKTWDNNTRTIILTILGVKIKIRKKYSLQTMNEQIKTLTYIINNCVEISKIKSAQGELTSGSSEPNQLRAISSAFFLKSRR